MVNEDPPNIQADQHAAAREFHAESQAVSHELGLNTRNVPMCMWLCECVVDMWFCARR